MKASRVLEEFSMLQSEKQDASDLIARINEFFSPSDKAIIGDEDIESTQSYGRKGELLDMTCSDLLDQFVINVLGLYFNTEMAWFKTILPNLNVSDHDLRVLALRDDLLYKLISKSNYYAVSPQHEWDALVHGHCFMAIDKDADTFAVCHTEEPANLYFRQGYKRNILEMYWTRNISLSALADMYGDHDSVRSLLAKDERSSRTFKLIHCVVPNTDYYNRGLDESMKMKVMNKSGMLYRVVTEDFFHGKDKSHGSSGAFDLNVEVVAKDRFVGARNRPSRNNAYGESTGKKLLIKSRIMNKLTRDGILTSGRQADPPRVVDPSIKKQLGGTDNIAEGQILFKTNRYGRDGQAVETLDTRGDLNGTLAFLEYMSQQVQRHLPTTDNTYKVSRQSIQEIQQRLRDQEKRLGPIRSHYLKEAVTPHLRRFYQIAKEQKYFDKDELQFEDESLERATPKFNFDALLGQSHRISKSLKVIQMLAQSQSVFQLKPAETLRINGAYALKTIAEGNSVMDILNSDAETNRAQQEMLDKANEKEQAEADAMNAEAIERGGNSLKNVVDAIGGGGIVGGEVPVV